MKTDSFILGCSIGLVFPVTAHLLAKSNALDIFSDKPLAWYVVAALLNLVLVRYGYRNAHEKSAQGIILVTFAATLMLLFTRQVPLL